MDNNGGSFDFNGEYLQDPKFTIAVEKLCDDYRKKLKNNKDDRMESLKRILERGNVDFNSLRKTHRELLENGNEGTDVAGDSAIEDDDRRKKLINKIEEIVQNIVLDIKNNKMPKLVLRNQRLWNNCVFGERLNLKEPKDSQMVTVDFRFKNSKPKFTLILHLLSTIQQMLIKHTSCTRREMYYQNISWIKKQSAIDGAIRDICCLLNAPEWELGILTTSHGLIAGPLEIVTKEGHKITCMNTGGVLIPQDVVRIKSMKSDAKFILVVEKDATFQKLLDDGALQRLKPCIIITGKGYPDVNTRLMLKFLVDYLRIPALALVDGDPHGIEIMCVYRFGSLTMSHLADKLAVPTLRWIGVHPKDIRLLSAPSLPLTSRDIAKCRDLLGRPYCNAKSLLREQVQIILQRNQKTELEGIDTISQAYLTDRYIPHKICTNDMI